MKHLPIVACLLIVAAPVAAEEKFFFQKGDRIVFLGDSITEQYQYSNYIEVYLTTRFPDWNLFFLNAGIGGDTANGGANRFQKHVLDEKPTAITINFGMNDGGYGKFDEERNDTYVRKTTEMLEAAKKAGVRVALVSPNAVDRRVAERFKLYLETQKQFYAPLKEIAEKNGAAFADQYARTRAALEKMEQDDPKAAKVKPFGDGFHTSPPGGLLMAHAILTELKAPAKVSDVAIEGRKTTVERCKIDKLEISEDKIAFSRTDEAVPMAIQKDWLTVIPYCNDLKDLNWYGLKMKALKQGIWEVFVDGKSIGKYSADQLAEGVNLGNLTSGPIYDHAQKIFTAVAEKNRINSKRFRGTILSKKPDAEVIAKLLDEIKAKQTDIHKMCEPKTWSYEVKLVK
jgi:lysophospholipase L1-like esterase